MCCYNEVLVVDSVPCSPGSGGGRHVEHRFCMDCVRKQIELDVTRGLGQTRCISLGNCGGVFSSRMADRVLTEGMRRLGERERIERSVREAGLEGFWGCPFCDFGALCEEVENETSFWCRNGDCQRVSCRRCRREMHWGSTCSREGRGDVEGDVEVELPGGVVRCPRCFRLVGKEEDDGGCNMVRCTCEGRPTLCVLCGKDISRDNHRHFSRTFEDEPGPPGRGCYMYDASGVAS